MTTTKDTTCGLWILRPNFLQKFATSRCFMIVYGFLGMIQAMSFIYFVVSLTTMERRFKIPTKTTGIMLSGNEISQVLLSLFLSYFGGQRNRPKWIAWGVIFCSLSCFILASPHFIYGAGEDALALTKEYADFYDNNSANKTIHKRSSLCQTSKELDDTCEEFDYFSEFSIIPALLVFFSQFVLGIGNTLYYSLGQTYMDDNTKKTNTPMLLGYACALRTLGPAVGFILGPICLSIYIDPSLTPIIDKSDARWMGAWWLGWILLGIIMFLFSLIIGLFPKHLPKPIKEKKEKDLPQYPKFTPKITENSEKDEIPICKNEIPIDKNNSEVNNSTDSMNVNTSVNENETPFPTMKEFPNALKRILKNKIIMSNIGSTTFYILGSSVYITYLAKYIEVTYNRASATAMLMAGPVILIGIVSGFLLSGYIISTKQPRPRRLLFWNVIVGVIFLCGQISFIFLGCPQSSIEIQLSKKEKVNFTAICNKDCMCDGIKYEPVCHKPTQKVYYSPCHAGCKSQLSQAQVYTNCSCLESNTEINLLNFTKYYENDTFKQYPYDTEDEWNIVHAGTCSTQCSFGFYSFVILTMIINVLGSSSKIANILVNYRCVDKKDKSFGQGMLLLIISLFALIPGPIFYGAIMDSTCIEWGEKCGKRTNCLMYNKDDFRFYINITAFSLTVIAVLLDTVVWYLCKNLDLYSEEDNKDLKPPKSENNT